jgi:hypothetical protein
MYNPPEIAGNKESLGNIVIVRFLGTLSENPRLSVIIGKMWLLFVICVSQALFCNAQAARVSLCGRGVALDVFAPIGSTRRVSKIQYLRTKAIVAIVASH